MKLEEEVSGKKFDIFVYFKDILAIWFLLFFGSALAVSWLEVSVTSGWSVLYYFVLPLVLTVLLHEGLHALVAKLCGADVGFGVSAKYVMITPYVSFRTPLTVKKARYVTAAPILISVVAFLVSWLTRSPFWALLYIFNTAGMAGDFLVLLVLSKMPPEALVWDEGTAMKSEVEFPEPYPSLVSKVLVLLLVLMILFIVVNFRVEVEVVYVSNQTNP
ncbi:DUF3267 domain-containing protein [Thermococcus stetteri]|uniref:DUF3267 domain-containing protein n=1 Tax=Thermococcus stetteri TaxID=49900 RepID=UPI001AE9BE32|nr:DUF3267 domain-containing protein [Thermococcus stetteri]MBP1911952.1 hypothetical protein [Thermococcus stetteri]